MALVAWAGWLKEGAAEASAGWFREAPGSASPKLASASGESRPSASGRTPTHSFPSSRGILNVREDDSALGHFEQAGVHRACEVSTGEEFDLRRLRAAAEAGGMVSLGLLEAMELEVEIMGSIGPHVHVTRCHGSLTENVGFSHSRLLLCDPCVGDLAAHLAAGEGKPLPITETTDLGQQLAFGLSHLHNMGILCGSGLVATGVLRGKDGFWKLGDFSGSGRLPMYASVWIFKENRPAPPEARKSDDSELTAAADVWMVGHLLAQMALRGSAATSAEDGGDDVPMLAPSALLEPLVARLWVLLHWLLSGVAKQRPGAGDFAALLGALQYMEAHEILQDMPKAVRERVFATGTAAARNLALEAAIANTPKNSSTSRDMLIDRLASASLAEVREALADAALADADEIEQLCRNCGIGKDLDDDVGGSDTQQSEASIKEGTSDSAPSPLAGQAIGQGDLSLLPDLI